jgi:hypothetical protein
VRRYHACRGRASGLLLACSTQSAGNSVSPDGRRFLVRLQDARAIPTQVRGLQSWLEELEAKVPVSE